jgi:hypothetical protein
MTLRRWVLSLIVFALLVSATTRVRAGGAIDAEGGAYGGEGEQHWLCGPTTGVRYGGVGGNIRVRPGSLPELQLPERNAAESQEAGPNAADTEGSAVANTAPRAPLRKAVERTPFSESHGFVVTLGGAVEYREHRFLRDCVLSKTQFDPERPCGNPVAAPPNGPLGAGHVRIGYDARYFGAHAGVLARGRHERYDATRAELVARPEFIVRVLPSDTFHLELGYGAADSTMLLRPGLFLNANEIPIGAARLQLGIGFPHIADSIGVRASANAFIPVGQHVELGVGAAYINGAQAQFMTRFHL